MFDSSRAKQRRRCAPRRRRLLFEQYESRTLLASAPAGADKTLIILEDSAHTFVAADFGFTDPFDTPANNFLGVKITTLPLKGSLALNGAPVVAGQFIPAASVPALRFVPVTNGNGVSYAAITFQVQDDGGTADGGQDLDTSPNTLTINVTPVNDPPLGASRTVTTIEDRSYYIGYYDLGYDDYTDTRPFSVLGDQLNNVIITSVPARGRLFWKYDEVTAQQLPLTVPSTDLFYSRIEFRPDANAHGFAYGQLTFRVQDDGGTAHGGADTDPLTRTLTIDVRSVNDAPVDTDKTIATLEDTTYTFSPADFGYSDPSDSPPNPLLSVLIVAAPNSGTLKNHASTVWTGMSVPAADLMSGKLTFVPAANVNGQSAASFEFRVQDSGGTSLGGRDLDRIARTISFDITPLNDPPSGRDATLLVQENATYTFGISDFGFTDAADAPPASSTAPHQPQAVIIETMPAAGTLRYQGALAVIGDTIPIAALAQGSLQFTPAPGTIGNSDASITFRVQDNGGTALGGLNTDATPNTLTFAVVAGGQSIAPIGTDADLTILEDAVFTFGVSDFGFRDAGQSLADSFSGLKVTTRPALGVLTLRGLPVLTGQSIPAAEIAAGQFQFSPAGDGYGLAYTSFTFQVQDSGGTAGGGLNLDPTPNTVVIRVVEVNDPPVGRDTNAPLYLSSPHRLFLWDFSFSDVADDPPDRFVAVKVATTPTAGSLMLSGATVTAGQLISVADIEAGKLQFASGGSAWSYGQIYSSFTFQLQDDGGTDNGGLDLDPVPNKLSFYFDIGCSCPVSSIPTLPIYEDAPYPFSLDDFALFEGTQDATAIRIASLPWNGVLRHKFVPVSAGELIPLNEIAAGNLIYYPPINASGQVASISYVPVFDNFSSGQSRSFALTVVPTNDPPSSANSSINLPFDATHTFSLADFPFNEFEGDDFQSVKIETLPASGALLFDGKSVPAGQNLSPASIAAGKLTFSHLPYQFGAALAQFQFRVKDDGGTANGGRDTDLLARTLQLNVTPAANHEPSGTNHTVSGAREDTPYTFGLADFPFSDNDGGTQALAAIRITTLPALGSLTLAGPTGPLPVTPGQFIAAANIVLGKLQFLANPHASGFPYTSFRFQVQDVGGTATVLGVAGVDLDQTPNTLTINVTPVNDPPSGTSSVKTLRESVNYTFATSDFGFTNPHDLPPNGLTGVYITTLPAAGTLFAGGISVTPGQLISVVQLMIGELVFAAPSQAAALTTSFTFQVRDDGGTFQGGVDTDPVAKTLTLYMARADQQISGQNHAVTGFEDTPYTFSAADFPFADTYDAPYSGLKHISLWSIPLSGKLTYYGANVVLGVTGTNIVSAQDLAQGALVYVPAANQSGPSLASFNYYITDLGNNRTPTLSAQTINLTAVNDPPQGVDRSVSMVVQSRYTFSLTDFPFSDWEGHALQSLHITAANIVAGASLTLSGFPVTTPTTITVTRAQLVAGQLIYNASFSPRFGDTILFRIQDDGGIANGGQDTDSTSNTLTISVVGFCNGCNLTIGRSRGVTTREDTPYTFATSDFVSIDPFGYPTTFDGISIRLVAGGSLQLGGLPVGSGTVPASDIQAGRFRFVPAANANGASLGRMNFDVLRDGGFPEGGDYDATISVMPVNDPPLGSDHNVFGSENSPLTIGVADIGFSDPVDVPANALQAIRIQTLPARGSLLLAATPVTVGQIISVTDIASGNLRFEPLPNTAGFNYAAFNHFVMDNGGTASGGIDTAISSTTISISIGKVCGRPSYDFSLTATILEDGTYFVPSTLIALGEDFDNALVTLKRPPTAGTLFFGTTQVVANQRFTTSQFASGLVRYVPPANGNGAALGSFEIVVGEDGDLCGPLGSGVITVHVTSVNDPPSGLDKLITTLEDASYTFTAADFGFTDLFDTPPHSLAAVQITSLPAKGTLAHAGTPVTAGQRIAIATIGTLVFSPASNANGLAYTSFPFQVQDNGGPTSGGQDLDPTPNTLTINVTPVNDAPSFTAGSDVTGMDTDGLLSILAWAKNITSGPANETDQGPLEFEVQNNNNALFEGAIGQPRIDSATGNLTFDPAPNAHGTAVVTVELVDAEGTAAGGVDTSLTKTFNIRIDKPFRWHNTQFGLDVMGTVSATNPTGKPDGQVVPGDALAIINYINAFGSGPVPSSDPPIFGQFQAPYMDTANSALEPIGDNLVTPGDVLAILNYINAFGSGPIPAAAAINAFAQPPQPLAPEGEADNVLPPPTFKAATISPDLLTLLATDALDQRQIKAAKINPKFLPAFRSESQSS